LNKPEWIWGDVHWFHKLCIVNILATISFMFVLVTSLFISSIPEIINSSDDLGIGIIMISAIPSLLLYELDIFIISWFLKLKPISLTLYLLARRNKEPKRKWSDFINGETNK